MKKLIHKSLSAVLVLTIVLSLFSGLSINTYADDLPSSGSCGNNVRYTFTSSTGKLIISGSGEITNGSPFYNQTSIKTVVVESGVTSIGSSAFSGCSGLTGIIIPNSVTRIYSSAFRGCSGLTSINIPNSVTSIGYGAFYNCSGLTSVTIGNGVTSIGEYAFYNCSGLTSVTIPDSVTSIGDRAFYGCRSLTSITIPDSVTSIGDFAFCDCSGLTSVTIPNSVTSIGAYAFSDCSGLTSITIPDSVTSIGYGAFYNCSGLTSVNISSIGAWCKISFGSGGSNPLCYAQNLYLNGKLVTELVIPDSVTSIGDFAFYGCRSLTSVTIPDSVTSIGGSAFYGCSGLTSVTISNSITNISDSTFEGCTGLTSITIPDSVTSIGAYAFYGCRSLNTITIPNSIRSIGSYAFGECETLRIKINSLEAYCKIDFNTSPFSDYGGNKNQMFLNEKLVSDLVIPDSITSIDNDAFSGFTFRSITIPNSVTSIGDGAFSWCLNLKGITIPDSVTSIGNSAFYCCKYLKEIVIPASVTSIGKKCFYGCRCLAYIDIKGDECIINDSEDNDEHTIPSTTTIIINGSKAVFEYARQFNRKYICNHVEVMDSAEEPTCTNSGLSEGSHCKVCGTVIQSRTATTPALGHDYDSKITSPTCTKKGFTTHTCSRCGNSFVDGETDALGHNYVAQVTAPTCTEKGFITYTCSRCTDSYTDDYTVATGHSPAETVKENEITATCTSSGSFDAVVYCSVCRSELSREHKTVSALGHDIVIDQVKSPTCTENGFSTQGSHCARCNEVLIEQEIIPALGHDWTNWSIVTAPVACKDGLSIRICNSCNEIENLTIPSGESHSPITVKEDGKAATCTADGSYDEVVYCSVCKEELSRIQKTVVALGHNASKKALVKPTGTQLGYIEHSCSRCGEVQRVDSYTAPTGKLTLKHSARTANAIKVQWNNVKTASGYQVQISTKDGKKWSTYATLKAGVTNYTFKNLAAGNNYKFRVRFFIKAPDKKNYFSPWSTTLNSPTLPTGTTLTKLTSAKKAFTAQWKKNATVTGYQIQYSLKSNFSGTKTITVKNPKTLKAVVKKLYAGKYYYVRIRTYKAISKVNYYSAWSKTYKVKTK